MEKKINIDYIGVVKENKGSYTYEQIVIQKSRELLTVLDAMCRNSNRTVLEMQDCFTAHFGVKPKTSYDCCLPYDYDSSYIGYVCLPEKMTIEQYRQGKQEVAEKARREFEDRAKNSPFVTSFSQEQAEREKFISGVKSYLGHVGAYFMFSVLAFAIPAAILQSTHKLELRWHLC